MTVLDLLCDRPASVGGGLEGMGRERGQEVMKMSLLDQHWDCNSGNSPRLHILSMYSPSEDIFGAFPKSVHDLIYGSSNSS